MSERTFAFHPDALSTLLRPLLFGLAIAAGVVAGERTDSFLIGLLGFLVTIAAGRALRRLVHGQLADAVYEALWPAGAAGFAILFIAVGLPGWAAALVAIVAAGMARDALAAVFLPERRRRDRWLRPEAWGVPERDDVLPGRFRETKEDS